MTHHDTTEARCTLDAEPSSAAEARRFVESTLAAWGVDELSDRTALVVDELVTNSILHGIGPIAVALRRQADAIIVEVEDREPRLPVPAPRPPDAALSFGRGLHLVEAVATSWGARPTSGGKVVWAHVEAGP